jgi:phosphatidylglycerol:prolipoprotein diacylglycerol transferase
MYPVLFRIGSFEVTTFGVLVAVAALVGIKLFTRELVRSRLPREAVDAAMFGVIGGLAGAKLLRTGNPTTNGWADAYVPSRDAPRK